MMTWLVFVVLPRGGEVAVVISAASMSEAVKLLGHSVPEAQGIRRAIQVQGNSAYRVEL